jgi:CRISPR-associated protein Csd2
MNGSHIKTSITTFKHKGVIVMETKEILKNKIDFAVIVSVNRANPNGDPLSGNRPRIDYEGYGEISDVCIKRKIRNRLMQKGHSIFVQSDDNRVDEYRSLRERAKAELKDVYKNLFKKEKKKKGEDEKQDTKKEAGKADEIFRAAACDKWLDVRAFGQVFAFGKESGKAESNEGDNDSVPEVSDDSEKPEKGPGVSIGIRGPVSIHPAFSICKVNDRAESQQIIKSVNLEKPGPEKASDTMGMKHRINHGVYVFYGSINPQLAALPRGTGFNDEDAKAIKEALKTLFVNDESSARPAGTMEVHKLYWWEQKQGEKQYSSAKVHRTVRDKVKAKKEIEEPKSIADYDIPNKSEIEADLPGLTVEIIDGE